MSLETAQKVIVPQKKIMSRSFLNSGTLIVTMYSFHGSMVECPNTIRGARVQSQAISFDLNLSSLYHKMKMRAVKIPIYGFYFNQSKRT